ncbi:MAG: fibronectin type III domain-containing protein [Candidatus Moraniibacteriota bacterium]
MSKTLNVILAVLVWLFASVANAAPSRIEPLSCSAPGQGVVSCTWSKPTPAAGSTLSVYECKRSTANITALNWGTRTQITPMPAVSATNPSLSVTGLPAATVVYLACRTQDSTGSWAVLSNVVSVTTQAAGAVPSAPSTISAVATVRHDELNVWWAIASGTPTVTGYRVYRSLTQNGTYVLAGQTNDPVVQAIPIGGLNADTEYWFTVAAVNANGEGPRSAPAMGKTVRSVRDVDLTWNPVTGNSPEIQAQLTDYVVYWGEHPQTMTGAGNIAASTTTYTVYGLARYSPWYFCVDVFYGSLGHSTCSNYAMITSPTGTDLILESAQHAPSGLTTSTVNTETTTRDVTFNWVAPSGVSGLQGYKLLLGDGEARVTSVVTLAAGTTTHTVSGVLRTARLDATVVALYAWGESRPANPVVSWKTE